MRTRRKRRVLPAFAGLYNLRARARWRCSTGDLSHRRRPCSVASLRECPPLTATRAFLAPRRACTSHVALGAAQEAELAAVAGARGSPTLRYSARCRHRAPQRRTRARCDARPRRHRARAAGCIARTAQRGRIGARTHGNARGAQLESSGSSRRRSPRPGHSISLTISSRPGIPVRRSYPASSRVSTTRYPCRAYRCWAGLIVVVVSAICENPSRRATASA